MQSNTGILLMKKQLFARSACEAIGAFAIVFFGCGAIMLLERAPHALSPTAIPLVFGLVVAAMIYAFGHISGAHFNPAVTLAFAIARHFPMREIAAYWSAQLLGALLAIAALWFLLPAGLSYGATVPHVTTIQACGWEFLLTFIMMIVIMAVATDTRAVGTMAGVAIGAVVALDAYVGGWATGASMNPVRSLAPAIAEGTMNVLWLYIAMPMLGAACAALVYKLLSVRTTE